MLGVGRLKSYVKRTFNVSEWMSKDLLLGGYRSIRTLYSEIGRKESHRVESFEQAIHRLGLDEQAIHQRMLYYKKTAWLYGLVFVLTLGYTLTMLKITQWFTAITSIAYSALVFSFFFKESFWYMQMKKRRLGLGFRDWLRFVLCMG